MGRPHFSRRVARPVTRYPSPSSFRGCPRSMAGHGYNRVYGRSGWYTSCRPRILRETNWCYQSQRFHPQASSSLSPSSTSFSCSFSSLLLAWIYFILPARRCSSVIIERIDRALARLGLGRRRYTKYRQGRTWNGCSSRTPFGITCGRLCMARKRCMGSFPIAAGADPTGATRGAGVGLSTSESSASPGRRILNVLKEGSLALVLRFVTERPGETKTPNTIARL